jgi:ATP-dependent RNA helicase DDX51/DBP6
VAQVRETFEILSKGRGLKIGVATGQHSFQHEQALLVGDSEEKLQGGQSKVDVLICTPGRLIDHLNGTPNFTLQHLRFLVIDEADRLVTQAFQDWLTQVLSAIRAPARLLKRRTSESSILYHDALTPAWLHQADGIPDIATDYDERIETSCQKLLFSATLTRDPSKIAALKLRNPQYFVLRSSYPNLGSGMAYTESFEMPPTLSEHMIVCDSADKPLILFYMIHSLSVINVLVFTKSAESTARLLHLFKFFGTAHVSDISPPHRIVAEAYSSDLNPADRKFILDRFKNSEIDVLICSDLVSRGIDISHVSHAVSYDAPVDMRKYVHRAGRTARAGKTGDAWTLVEEQEARYFKKMLSDANHLSRVKKMKVPEKALMQLRPSYQTALDKLKALYGRVVTDDT